MGLWDDFMGLANNKTGWYVSEAKKYLVEMLNQKDPQNYINLFEKQFKLDCKKKSRFFMILNQMDLKDIKKFFTDSSINIINISIFQKSTSEMRHQSLSDFGKQNGIKFFNYPKFFEIDASDVTKHKIIPHLFELLFESDGKKFFKNMHFLHEYNLLIPLYGQIINQFEFRRGRIVEDTFKISFLKKTYHQLMFRRINSDLKKFKAVILIKESSYKGIYHPSRKDNPLTQPIWNENELKNYSWKIRSSGTVSTFEIKNYLVESKMINSILQLVNSKESEKIIKIVKDEDIFFEDDFYENTSYRDKFDDFVRFVLPRLDKALSDRQRKKLRNVTHKVVQYFKLPIDFNLCPVKLKKW